MSFESSSSKASSNSSFELSPSEPRSAKPGSPKQAPFEPRVVRPMEDETAQLAGENAQRNLPNKHAGDSQDDWPAELTLLGKQLGREAVRLSNFYPAVADDEAFQQKLSAARQRSARGLARRSWFQRIWFGSAAAVMLVVICTSLLTSTGDEGDKMHFAPEGMNPGAMISGSNVPAGGALHRSLDTSFGGQLDGFPGVPLTPVIGVNQPQLPGLQHYRGLSGEEIEGLREFERPGTRISL